MKDLSERIDFSVLHTKAAYSAAQSDQGKNVAGFHRACLVADIGAHTADGLTVVFVHRDGTDSWEKIPDDQLAGGSNDVAITSSNANSQVYRGYIGLKEEIGAKVTDGGSGDATVGVYAIAGDPSQFPAN